VDVVDIVTYFNVLIRTLGIGISYRLVRNINKSVMGCRAEENMYVIGSRVSPISEELLPTTNFLTNFLTSIKNGKVSLVTR
jgi:hypothetical protein